MLVNLKGKTQKGKNRIREWGELWNIVARNETVLFSKEAGPWVSVIPMNIPEGNNSSPTMGLRWIHLKNDEDFIVNIQEK